MAKPLEAIALGVMVAVAACSSNPGNAPDDVIAQELRPATDGFYGRMYTPKSIAGRGPAVVALGGSEGGLTSAVAAAAFASEGVPSLAVAYFKAPDLPRFLRSIRLEYFAAALRWVASQPSVDPARIFVYGVSRGSEAALLLGIYYPDLVRGVVALVPSNVVGCAVPPHCDEPAWTLDRKAIPFKRGFGPDPGPDPAVIIQAERIRGPILFVCGGTDHIWDSCDMAKAMTQRLDHTRHDRTHQLLAYPDAGHGVGTLPRWTGTEPAVLAGISDDSNAAARADAWPKVLAFVRSAS